jgi:hypothetical protein
MRRAKSRRAEERDQSNRARARYTRGKGKRERERESTRRISLLPFFFFSSFLLYKGVVCLTFSLFFAQIWVHKLKLSRVSRKERFLRDIKFNEE